jgi:hypothetical protein
MARSSHSNFGEPHLEICEPRVPAKDALPEVRKLFARRNVTVRGDWHLWIYCCNWTVLDAGRSIGESENNDSFADATQLLDGQAFKSVSIEKSGNTRFTFDLDGTLETSPYDDFSEQWMLYQPDGNVLALRADGKYSHSKSDADQETEVWLPI